MRLKPLPLALAVVALAATGAFASAASATLTVNESFEYESPGLTFEAQHVGPAHCKGKYQVNPKKFPEKENETTLGPDGPSGGREVVHCKFINKHPESENTVANGHAFPEINPEADYWVSEWFKSFNPGQFCFVLTSNPALVKGKMGSSGHSYHVVAYMEYDRECHSH
jgi:hypothetical protein